MLRTRDLLLFVLILFFLGIAIYATVSRDGVGYSLEHEVAFTDASFEAGAVSSEESIDRYSIIERLRTKLANSIERIEPAPSVEAPEIEEVSTEASVGLQKCLYPDDALSMVPRWPLSGVKVAVREGARAVYVEEVNVIPAVSSTTKEEIITTITPLLQLPLVTLKQAEASCVPSEVVGVTAGGILMFNGDVNSYRKIPENALIGYARDGFPIYGVYSGEVDQCGGYDHPAGYRYTISIERDYIVGCYAGTVNKFTF